MAEPATRTPDVPDFDLYPGGDAGAGAGSNLRPDRELPEVASQARDIGSFRRGRLNETAERLGDAVGMAVTRARALPGELKDRFTLIRGRSSRVAGQKADELKGTANEQVRRARNRIQVLVRDYPLETIAGAAAVGVVLGAGLRMWRSKRG